MPGKFFDMTVYERAVAISASDTVPIATGPAPLFIAVTGNLVVVDTAGNTITITGAPVGMIVPFQVVRVNSTSLTATAYALYND